MITRRRNLTVVMGVADIGDFEAVLPLTQEKSHARFGRHGQPTLMGNHLFVDQSDGVCVCALRTNNGTLDRNVQNGQFFWRGIIRYTSYKLRAPANFVIVTEDGTVTSELTLYEGPAIELLPRATINQRFAVCRTELASLAVDKLRYNDEPHTWEPLNGEYGPSKLPLPWVGNQNYEAQSAAEYTNWLNAWQSGQPMSSNWESVGARIGPKMPAGPTSGSDPGGNGIDPNHGYERSRSNILLRRWKHARWMDRMNCALFSAEGTQMVPTDFPSPQQIALITGAGFWQWRNELPVFLTGSYDHAQYPHFNPGPVANQGELWNYESVWISHYIRAIQNGIAVWEYTGDPMVASDLLMLFEAMRFAQYSDRGDEQQAPQNGYVPPSLRAYIHEINNWPHNGFHHFDRAYGWALYLGAQVHRMGFNRADWLRKMIAVGEKAMMPNGIICRKFYPQFPQPDIQGIQTFHEMIIGIGYHAACTQMGRDSANKLRRMCESILDNPLMPSVPEQYHPDGSVKGPPHWIWTHKNYNDVIDPLTSETTNGGGDAAHVSQVLALTYLETHDQRWLNACLHNWFVSPNLPAKLQTLQAMYGKSWGGTLQAVLEQ